MKILNKCLITGIAAMGLSAAIIGTSAIAAPADSSYDACPMNMEGPGQGNCYVDQDNRSVHMQRWHHNRQQRQTALHDQLKLNADQEKAWKNYLAIVDANYQSMKPLSRTEIEKMTAPQRMQTMLDRMKERETKMSNQLSALKVFYNQLTPEQQKTFDNASLFNRSNHMNGRGHRGGAGPR